MLIAALVGSMVLYYVFTTEQQPRAVTLSDFTQAQNLSFVSRPDSLIANRQSTVLLVPGRYLGEDFIWFQTRGVGDYVEFQLNDIEPGQYEMDVYLAAARDFGIVSVSLNGRLVASGVDLFTASREVPAPLRLGGLSLASTNTLHIQLVGTNPESFPPHYQFGIDGVVIRR